MIYLIFEIQCSDRQANISIDSITTIRYVIAFRFTSEQNSKKKIIKIKNDIYIYKENQCGCHLFDSKYEMGTPLTYYVNALNILLKELNLHL